MITAAGISFGLLAGALLALFVHPILRMRLAPERRLRLLFRTLAGLVGASVAGALLGLLGLDAVAGYLFGAAPGFIAAFAYLEWREQRLLRHMLGLSEDQRRVVADVLRQGLDPVDPTSARELDALLDQLANTPNDTPNDTPTPATTPAPPPPSP